MHACCGSLLWEEKAIPNPTAVWPNTPIPTALQEFLKPITSGVKIQDHPTKIDDTEYPKTFFYEHDLHPGKTMNVQFSNGLFKQPMTLLAWLRKVKDTDKEGYTFDELCIKRESIEGEHNKSNTLEGVQNLGDKAVMCHGLNFQTVVFYCHEVCGTSAFMVSLVAADGTQTQALAICHSDTSGMNHQMLHQIMGVDPGTNPVCHFLGTKEILWVPNLAVDTAYQTEVVL
ncbi:hypothetical protein LR48_Vigan05g131800 [Vigna angularis]|uniref:BURP domain-containing protein n=1 Tax=Phaseolus angularis TaxID=3914 RepID=A0A0L9ULT4_PHAAN|nr:hypothetical protein LR48_Vigan05g131800 [Vigna angularis]